MKILKSFTIDFASGDTLDEDIEHYCGPVTECKGGGGSSGVQKTEPWEEQKPYLELGMERAENLYRSAKLTPTPYSGSTIAALSPETQQALSLTSQRALQGSPLIATAQNQLGNTLAGNFLNAGNPYMQSALRAAAQPTIENFQQAVMPGIEARFAQSGRYGSGAYGKNVESAYNALSRGLSEQATQAAMQNYGDERQLMQQAAFLAPQAAAADYQDLEKLAQVGEFRDQYSQQQINENIRRYEASRDAQQLALQNYFNLITGVPGGSTAIQSSNQRSNPLLGAAGGAAAGYAAGNVPGAILGGLLGLFG
jgi:hypothetical protein